MELVLGIDGGGTKTRIALARLDGSVVARCEAGSSNPHDVGWQGARAALAAAREGAFRSLGRHAEPVRAAAAGLAGVASEAERVQAQALLAELDFAAPPALEVQPDLEIAWRGAFCGEPGIVLVAGTGSVAYGRDACGRGARAGGWGPRVDDAGSATWIARQALAAAARGEDGRGPITTLGPHLARSAGCASFFELRTLLASRELPRDQLALLATEVLHAWFNGDVVAGTILERAGKELADCVQAVERALLPERLAIACTGGLFMTPSPIRDALDRALPQSERREPSLSPLGGALLAALELAGIPAGPAFRERLELC